MKAYTNLEQSRKLAEILPLESADGFYESILNPTTKEWDDIFVAGTEWASPEVVIPAWSLAALLNYLREIDFFPSIEADEHRVTMNVCYYDDEEGNLLHPLHDITTEADNFVDACVEMILKLHELKML